MTKSPPQGIPDDEMTERVTVSHGDYWVLEDPVTKQSIIASKDGEETLMCFHSEKDAKEFKRRYGVPRAFVPTYVPKLH